MFHARSNSLVAGMKVSVFCATYNQKDYIEEALLGILRQETSFPFEIIVQDDASTDGTAEIVRRVERQFPEKIRAIYQSENQYSKPVRPWRFFLPMAKGKYLAWCEGDDVWTNPKKLQLQVDLLDTEPTLSGCFTNNGVIDRMGEVLRVGLPRRKKRDFTHRCALEEDCPRILTLMVRRSAIIEMTQLPPTADKIINGDQLIAGIATRYGDIRYLDTITANYRLGSGSWSTIRHARQIETTVESFITIAQFLNRPDELQAIGRRISRRLADYDVLFPKHNDRWKRSARERMLMANISFNRLAYLGRSFQRYCRKLRGVLKHKVQRRVQIRHETGA